LAIVSPSHPKVVVEKTEPAQPQFMASQQQQELLCLAAVWFDEGNTSIFIVLATLR
jgi:hypothetical protein